MFEDDFDCYYFDDDDCIEYIVMLESGTIGKIERGLHPGIGDTVKVYFKDAAGETLNETGVILEFVEVL